MTSKIDAKKPENGSTSLSGQTGRIVQTGSSDSQTIARSPAPAYRIELVPACMSGKNVRAVLSVDAWCVLRNMVLKEDGDACRDCKSTMDLQCHETWDYLTIEPGKGRPARYVMRLAGFRTLCKLCHKGKHIRFAKTICGEFQRLMQHLCKVYALTPSQLQALEAAAVNAVQSINSLGSRELDLTFLNDEKFVFVRFRSGITLFSEDERDNCRTHAALDDLA